jgi:hypothetical protein
MGLQFVASALLGVDRDGRIGAGCEGVSARLNRSPGVSLACPLLPKCVGAPLAGRHPWCRSQQMVQCLISSGPAEAVDTRMTVLSWSSVSGKLRWIAVHRSGRQKGPAWISGRLGCSTVHTR